MTDCVESPACVSNHPEGWVMNARTIHEPNGRIIYLPEHKTLTLPCRCLTCIRHDYPELTIGPPFPTSYECSKDFIEKNRMVGLYKQPNSSKSITQPNPTNTLLKLVSSLERLHNDDEWERYLDDELTETPVSES